MELNVKMAESMGYGANNIIDKMLTANVVIALDNLASTAMSKMDVFDTLAAANKQLAEALAHVTKENEKFLSMVS